MSTSLSPVPVFKAFDNNGQPLFNGQLFTFAAGTSTPQATWVDSSQTTQNTNPVILNFRGEASIWLDNTLIYKFQLNDAQGNLIWTVDNIPGPLASLTANQIGKVLYPDTPAERTSGAVIVNYQYPPYTPDRYATNTTQGVTDMWPAIVMADKAAAADGASVNFISGELYGVNCTLNGASLSMTASWVCSGPAAIIQRIDFTTQTGYLTVVANQVSNLRMENLIFDGQITAAASLLPNVDIGPIGSFNDNSTESLWSQVFGVSIAGQNCTVESCIFKNFLRAGLWMVAYRGPGGNQPAIASGPPWSNTIALGNRVLNCKTIRNRGIFGDGFYVEECENHFMSGCYAYDYQRVGILFENNSSPSFVGPNGAMVVNCVSDYGHDAVTSGAQLNAGFYAEACDSIELVNCESKNTNIGYVLASAAGAAAGVYRPWTASHAVKGCKAIRCRQQGFRLEHGNQDANVDLIGCFAEVNINAALYSNGVGGAPCGVQIQFTPINTIVATKFNINCAIDMVGFGATSLTQYSAINVLNGGVTNYYQMDVSIRDCAFRWIQAGTPEADDIAVAIKFESVAAPNFGYIADILFSGKNNGGAQFAGTALVSNCTNHTNGYVMLSTEVAGGSSILNVENMKLSYRAAGGGNAGGTCNIKSCFLDYRNQIGWGSVVVSNSTVQDLFSGNKARAAWGSTATTFHLDNCTIARQLYLQANSSGTAGVLPLTLQASNCYWNLNFEVEPGLRIDLPAAANTSIGLSGCIFQNAGTATSSANGMMYISTSTGTSQFFGAGNTFDNTFVTGAGGHVLQYNNTPTFNDAPQTVATPFLTVFGVRATFGPF